MITPISSLNRNQQNLLDFGDSDSSEEEESNRAFRGRNHRSLVLRRVSLTLSFVSICMESLLELFHSYYSYNTQPFSPL